MWEQLYSFHTLRSSLPDFVERATNDPTSNDIYYAVPLCDSPRLTGTQLGLADKVAHRWTCVDINPSCGIYRCVVHRQSLEVCEVSMCH